MKINYTECTDFIRNPEMGYPTFGRWQDMTRDGIAMGNGVNGKRPVLQGYTNQLYTLTAFTKNGGGEDIPITDAALAALGEQLDELENNGGRALLRFAYDSRGKRDCEPESLDMILHHIAQIGEVLKKHGNAVAGLEAGIIGLFGEMHTSRYCASEYSRPIIQALLDACPDKKPVLLRTPAYLKSYTGLEYKDIAALTPERGSDIGRLGFYNDGYMGSDSDLGTWMEDTLTRKEGIDYLGRVGSQVFYGGEYSGAWWWTTRFHTWLPENAIPEMYRSNVDYVRGNVFHDEHVSYENFIYSEDYEFSWFPDNSAYYGVDCFRFIRDHLGYRFVIRESDAKVDGREAVFTGKVENTGFSQVINDRECRVIFRSESGQTYTVKVPLDVKEWKSCRKTDYEIRAALPEGAPAGRYDAFLRVSLPSRSEENSAKSSTKFANIGIYDDTVCGNFIGEVVFD